MRVSAWPSSILLSITAVARLRCLGFDSQPVVNTSACDLAGYYAIGYRISTYGHSSGTCGYRGTGSESSTRTGEPTLYVTFVRAPAPTACHWFRYRLTNLPVFLLRLRRLPLLADI